MDLISERTYNVMEKAMDGLMTRHNAISNNLANVDTPGYKPVKVEFEDQLKQAILREDNQKAQAAHINAPGLNMTAGMLDLRVTDRRHFGAKPITVGQVNINAYQDAEITYRTDSNAIDVDSEMTNLAKNDMQYETMATLMGRHYAQMKDVIRTSGGV